MRLRLPLILGNLCYLTLTIGFRDTESNLLRKSRLNNRASLVGVVGFELTTTGTQSRPSTRLRYTPGNGATIAGSRRPSLRNRHQIDGQLNWGSVCLDQPVPREVALARNRYAVPSNWESRSLSRDQIKRANVIFVHDHIRVAWRTRRPLNPHRDHGSWRIHARGCCHHEEQRRRRNSIAQATEENGSGKHITPTQSLPVVCC